MCSYKCIRKHHNFIDRSQEKCYCVRWLQTRQIMISMENDVTITTRLPYSEVNENVQMKTRRRYRNVKMGFWSSLRINWLRDDLRNEYFCYYHELNSNPTLMRLRFDTIIRISNQSNRNSFHRHSFTINQNDRWISWKTNKLSSVGKKQQTKRIWYIHMHISIYFCI